MRHDTRALFQLRVENGAQLQIGFGKQVDSQQIGGRVVLFEDVAVDDVGRLLQTQPADLCGAGFDEVGIQLDTGGKSAIALRGHDHDAAIAAAEVVHALAGFEPAELEHALDDAFGSGIVGRELFPGGWLRERGTGDEGYGQTHLITP